MNMTTMQMLAMQYGFRALIPLDMIANDYLSELTKTELHRKAKNQQLDFACINNAKTFCVKYHWGGGKADQRFLKAGLVHLARDAAVQHCKALIKLGGGLCDE